MKTKLNEKFRADLNKNIVQCLKLKNADDIKKVKRMVDKKYSSFLIDTWDTLDVHNLTLNPENAIKAPHLTEEQCRKVLLHVAKHHDCEIGINWNSIQCSIDELF